MRILWHSASPWCPTGYGTQTQTWTSYLQSKGHDVAISSYFGAPGFAADWGGIPVFPPPLDGNVHRLLPQHAKRFKPDVIIILADMWLLDPHLTDGYKTLCWLPTDTENNIGAGDELYLRASGVTPVAMSEHGQSLIARAGFGDLYVPHAIDMNVYHNREDRESLRAAFGISPGTFAVGINANNIDPVRKAFFEQMLAFSELNARHENSRLYIHSMVAASKSLDLNVIARDLGISDYVMFADQYRIQAGQYTNDDMRHWYAAMDLISNATYGEGFGLPAIEAQACGTPVVLSKGTSGNQLVGPGWLVDTEPYWNPVHRARWHRPSIRSLVKAYNNAYSQANPFKRQVCSQFASGYSHVEVGPQWLKILEDLK